MPTIFVGVGSGSDAKVRPVWDTVSLYWGTSNAGDIYGFEDIDSGVAAMPMSANEMMTGAENRAHAAFERVSKFAEGKLSARSGEIPIVLGVGIEGGIDQIRGHWVMMSYIAVTDGDKTFVTPTTGTPLPDAWVAMMSESGKDLRDFLRENSQYYDPYRGTNETLTKGMVGRNESMALALKSAFAPWVNREMYGVR